MKRKTYVYKGAACSLSALCRISGLSRHCIENRLNSGWTVEQAVSTPANEPLFPFQDEYKDKILDVKFSKRIPGVFLSMQPELGVTYTATPHGRDDRYKRPSRLYYIIELGQRKPLIVYPGEFQVLGISNI